MIARRFQLCAQRPDQIGIALALGGTNLDVITRSGNRIRPAPT
jgi:hypothetical protein